MAKVDDDDDPSGHSDVWLKWAPILLAADCREHRSQTWAPRASQLLSRVATTIGLGGLLVGVGYVASFPVVFFMLVAMHPPEFLDQAKAIVRHGTTMRAILKQHPSQRMVVHYEPGEIPDVPHELVYDPTDHDVARVIQVFLDRRLGRPRNCDITGNQVAPNFFDLAVDCY